MKIVLASRNKKKVRELETLLASLASVSIEVLSLDDIGYTDEIVEDGVSFEENAMIKASVPASLGYIGIADDSGLCVDALNGAPGIYSARYAGEPSDDAANNRKLILEMNDVPTAERGAAFVSAIACVFPENSQYTIPRELLRYTKDGRPTLLIRGECRGEILREASGQDGFGYDPLFYVPSHRMTFAEMSPETKNSISHRGMAMRAFCTAFAAIVLENKE